MRVGAATQPVINLLRDELLDAPIVHGDETEVQVLKEPGRKAQAKSYMWVQMTQASGKDGTGPPIRLFGYRPSRGTDAAKALYEGMRPGAVLMSDGYEPYEVVARQHSLVHLGCWAHYLERSLIQIPMPLVAGHSGRSRRSAARHKANGWHGSWHPIRDGRRMTIPWSSGLPIRGASSACRPRRSYCERGAPIAASARPARSTTCCGSIACAATAPTLVLSKFKN